VITGALMVKKEQELKDGNIQISRDIVVLFQQLQQKRQKILNSQ